jgi:hypothetical protein
MAYTPETLATMGSSGMMVRSAQATDPTVSRVWTYVTADAMTTVRAADYFSDASSRGMTENDVVHVITTSAGAPSTFYMTLVYTVSSSGKADLSDGTAITLTNT